MRRPLTLALIALTLNLGISAPALAEDEADTYAEAAAAESAAEAPSLAAMRTEMQVAVYGTWVGSLRFSAECEKRGYDKAKAIRRSIDRTGVKYEAELAEAKRAYEDEANADKRREVDQFVEQGLKDFSKNKAQTIKRECKQAVADAPALEEKMSSVFSMLASVAQPIAAEAPAEDAAVGVESASEAADAAAEAPAAKP